MSNGNSFAITGKPVREAPIWRWLGAGKTGASAS
jgi:hypothetical protein